MNDNEILNRGQITIHDHEMDKKILFSMKYSKLLTVTAEDTSKHLDLLWLSSTLFKQPKPGWQGFMQCALRATKHPGQSNVFFLPMIDQPPVMFHAYSQHLCFWLHKLSITNTFQS